MAFPLYPPSPRRLLFLGGKSNESFFSPSPIWGSASQCPKCLYSPWPCVSFLYAHICPPARLRQSRLGLRKRCRKRLDCGTKEGERGAKMLISEKLQGRSVFTIVSQFLTGALEGRTGRPFLPRQLMHEERSVRPCI